MNKYIAILLLTFSGSAFAKSYVCISDAVVAISHNYDDSSVDTPKTYDPKLHRFILTNNSGDWILKSMDSDFVLFHKCISEYVCESISSFGGFNGSYFVRNNKNRVFSLVMSTADPDTNSSITMVAKGRCSKI